jgi:hypothetical protein
LHLFFASPSALFPISDGDIVGFSLFDPLDGVSGDGIVGLYFVALSAPGTVPAVIGDNGAIHGCVAPAGVAIVVGQDPGAPTCMLAGASVPESSSLVLLAAALLGCITSRTTRSRRSAALRRFATGA